MYKNVLRTLDVTVHNDPVTSVAVQVLYKKGCTVFEQLCNVCHERRLLVVVIIKNFILNFILDFVTHFCPGKLSKATIKKL